MKVTHNLESNINEIKPMYRYQTILYKKQSNLLSINFFQNMSLIIFIQLNVQLQYLFMIRYFLAYEGFAVFVIIGNNIYLFNT